MIHYVRVALLIPTRHRAGAQHTRGLRKRRCQNGIFQCFSLSAGYRLLSSISVVDVDEFVSSFDFTNGPTVSFALAARRAAYRRLSEL